MNTEVKKRTWVKDAAIIFLAILLVLTFFSSTILNASLTEVATQQVKSGTITAKVRGTGKVIANGNNNVKAKGTVTIAKVMVRTGEEVKTGDVLFVLGEGDSDELEAAKNALVDLQESYDVAVASLPITNNYVREQNQIEKERKDMVEAERRMNEIANLLKAQQSFQEKEASISGSQIAELVAQQDKTMAELETLRTERDVHQNAEDVAENELNAAITLLDELTKIPEPSDEGEKERLKEDIEKAQAAAETAEKNYYDTKSKHDFEIQRINADVLALETKLVAIQTKLTQLQNERQETASTIDEAGEIYKTIYTYEDYLSAKRTYEDTCADYISAQADLANSVASSGQSVNVAYVNLQNLQNKIDRQKEKIKELSGEGEEKVITAAVSGTVTEVNCSSGDTVIRDDILAVIEVADMGYTVSFSVTNDQARRLKVGDEATISNFYWGNEIKATLKSIATDKENPQNKKVLTFDLEGNVTAGSELTISVGQKSASYDLVVPNSAIRSDNNGQFVLMVSAKNSALGNRYFAKRVKVDVLAEDDNNSAVTAELDAGDFVITTTSAPVNSGEQVRLADSAN